MAPEKRLITYSNNPNKKRRRRRVAVPFIDLTGDTLDSMGFVPAQHNPEPLRPKRPDSQRAATMAVEPNQDSIDTVVAFVQCDAETARRYLRVKQNSTEAAINAILECEDITKLEEGTTWDEAAFAADRDGNQSLQPLGTSAAPTRGPSPAPSLGVTNPKTKADEDSDLARAIAASQADFPSFPQESGVVNTDGSETRFGPATRDQYNANDWAVVPFAQELVPDAPVKERVYDGQGPRFLKHLPDGDYTPNLITICHSIAKAREALILRADDFVKPDYGFDEAWWKGHPIPMPRIVHTVDGNPAEPDSDMYDELITETQRLAAFLDCSERVYANVGGITQSELIKTSETKAVSSGSLMELFLKQWTNAAISKLGPSGRDEPVKNLFTTIVGTNDQAGMDTPEMTMVDVSIQEPKSDLLELLDGLLWDTNPNSSALADNYIEVPADVLVMKIQQTTQGTAQLGVEVPASLYLDKYLKENIASTRSIREQMSQGKKRVAKMEEIEKKLKSWQHPKKSAQLDARGLLTHTLGHFSGENRKNANKADTSNNAILAEEEPPHYQDIVKKLEQVIIDIDKKLEVLAEEKEKTRKAVSEMSKAPPAGLQESELQHRYTLRGVATKPNITYVLQMKEGVEGDQEMLLPNDEDTTPPGYQWWRIDYEVSGSSAKIMRTKAGDYDVLRAVELEHSSALLVYASDEACSDSDYYVEGIPGPLKAFIEKDNQQLQKELQADDTQPPPYSMGDIPRQSIERRASNDSMGVGARSEAGSPDFRDDGVVQSHSGFGLGYDVKADTGMPDRPSTPTAEIHLGEDEGLLPTGNTTEMSEKPGHEPLVPRPGTGGDTRMGGVESQDMGVGGASHVEDADEMR